MITRLVQIGCMVCALHHRIYSNQSWKVIEKLKVLSAKRNDFGKRKTKSESEKKIEKPKTKSKSFIYITFLSFFPEMFILNLDK